MPREHCPAPIALWGLRNVELIRSENHDGLADGTTFARDGIAMLAAPHPSNMPDFGRDVTLANHRLQCFLLGLLVSVCTLSLSGHLFAEEKGRLAIMPAPASVTVGEGEFLIDESFGVVMKGYDEPRLARARQRFLDILSKETGIPFKTGAIGSQAHFIIQTAGPGRAVQQLGEDESYDLMISTTHVELKAANPLGVLHGLQTFLQLVRINERGFSVPVVTVVDAPRFP